MIKIIYVSTNIGDEDSDVGCYTKLDPIFYADTNRNGFRSYNEEFQSLNEWLAPFGGRIERNPGWYDPDYLVFDNDEDAIAFKLKFGL